MTGPITGGLGGPGVPIYSLQGPPTPAGQAAAQLGASVALFADDDGGGAGIAVGVSRGGTGAIAGTGEVRVYRYDPTASAAWPFRLSAHAVGESYRLESLFGASVAVTGQGGTTYLIVGAPFGTVSGQTEKVDNGTVYVAPLVP